MSKVIVKDNEIRIEKTTSDVSWTVKELIGRRGARGGPGPHEFVKVQRSDDLCRVCAKGELDALHVRVAKRKKDDK